MKHLADYQHIHATQPDYGKGSGPAVCAAIRDLMTPFTDGPHSVIDYGAGRSRMLFEIFPTARAHCRYDPAIPELAEKPAGGFQCGICTDVLEHVPEEELALLLRTLQTKAGKWVFIICTRPAGQILPSGENAHCTVRPAAWWLDRLRNWWPHARQVDLGTHEDRPGFATF